MKAIADNQRFPIGTQYKPIGKSGRRSTVSDVHRTYNSDGELVRLRYVATSQLMGQTLTEYDICDATIARGGGLDHA
jgi:hypothetical protein